MISKFLLSRFIRLVGRGHTVVCFFFNSYQFETGISVEKHENIKRTENQILCTLYDVSSIGCRWQPILLMYK